jgi:hypothetical protein
MDEHTHDGFTAQRVAAEEWPETDAFIVAFGENADGAGQYLAFQTRLAAYDDQDVAQGVDTYCLVNDMGACVYGGVAAYQFTRRALILQLDERASQVLGVGQRYIVGLQTDEDEWEAVRAGLERVFDRARPDTTPQLERNDT